MPQHNHVFTSRWVPCQYCLQRVKLFSIDDQFDLVVWMHQESDEQEPYRDCKIDDIQAHAINGFNIAHPYLTL